MRPVYKVLAYIVAAEVVIQAMAMVYAVAGQGKWVMEGGVLDTAVLESRDFVFPEVLGYAIHGINGAIVIPLLALALLVTRYTGFGRMLYAVGGNAEAARLSGIPVTRVKVAVYLMTSVLTAIAALIAASRTNGVTPGNMGLIRELHVITAVVIGGTSLSGGRATMVGTLLGALIFGTLSNGMNLLNLNSNWQLILTGMIILGASMLDSWSTRTEAR